MPGYNNLWQMKIDSEMSLEENKVIEIVVGDHDIDKDPDCENGCELAQRFEPEEIIQHNNFNEE